jgi:hypothetical protein
MKQFRSLCVPLFSAVLLLVASCGGRDDKTGTSKTATDSTTTTTTTPAPATTTSAPAIDTTPATIMVARHKVTNFAKWKASYEAHDSMRTAAGLHNFVIGRGVPDSNMVMVAVKADDVAKAKAFSKNASLKRAMQQGGVVGTPTFMFHTIVYQDNAPNIPDLRSMTNFTVKDWNAWKKSFDSGRQVRLDNGLTERAYGHDVDDNHKVVVVVAINDSAKANAFWKSDLLKQRRAESGVVGEPKRFVYRIVQKY